MAHEQVCFFSPTLCGSVRSLKRWGLWSLSSPSGAHGHSLLASHHSPRRHSCPQPPRGISVDGVPITCPAHERANPAAGGQAAPRGASRQGKRPPRACCLPPAADAEQNAARASRYPTGFSVSSPQIGAAQWASAGHRRPVRAIHWTARVLLPLRAVGKHNRRGAGCGQAARSGVGRRPLLEGSLRANTTRRTAISSSHTSR